MTEAIFLICAISVITVNGTVAVGLCWFFIQDRRFHRQTKEKVLKKF